MQIKATTYFESYTLKCARAGVWEFFCCDWIPTLEHKMLMSVITQRQYHCTIESDGSWWNAKEYLKRSIESITNVDRLHVHNHIFNNMWKLEKLTNHPILLLIIWNDMFARREKYWDRKRTLIVILCLSMSSSLFVYSVKKYEWIFLSIFASYQQRRHPFVWDIFLCYTAQCFERIVVVAIHSSLWM